LREALAGYAGERRKAFSYENNKLKYQAPTPAPPAELNDSIKKNPAAEGDYFVCRFLKTGYARFQKPARVYFGAVAQCQSIVQQPL